MELLVQTLWLVDGKVGPVFDREEETKEAELVSLILPHSKPRNDLRPLPRWWCLWLKERAPTAELPDLET